MPLDSDVSGADAQLHVEFYEYDKAPYKGQAFVRIMAPGDKTNIIEQPVREHHKARFARQWLYYQMRNNEGPELGTPLENWHKEVPDELNDYQMAELQILKFRTIEQVATASDSQLQKVGMGAQALRERAKNYLARKNNSVFSDELSNTRKELDELKAKLAQLMEERKPGRPRKEAVDVQHNASIGDAGHE
jgi:hypothetical protein